MRPTAELLTAFESCPRNGYWSTIWRKHKMTPLQMLAESVHLSLFEDSKDPGENAGEHYVTLATHRGLEIEHSSLIYRCAMNHAAIADLIVTSIRPTTTWRVPDPVGNWISSVMTNNGVLRRFVPVSHWTDEREIFERRSWFCLGEVAHYRLPMQLIVANVGHISGGRRTGYFSKALLHPNRSHLRFRRRSRGTIEGFKESWAPIYREDHAEIDREKWLQAMLDDDVLQDSLFVLEIPVPSEAECNKICALAERQMATLTAHSTLPPLQLSTCFDPISPCPFRYCCHAAQETEPRLGEFDRL